jgi:hypothetical protein
MRRQRSELVLKRPLQNDEITVVTTTFKTGDSGIASKDHLASLHLTLRQVTYSAL